MEIEERQCYIPLDEIKDIGSLIVSYHLERNRQPLTSPAREYQMTMRLNYFNDKTHEELNITGSSALHKIARFDGFKPLSPEDKILTLINMKEVRLLLAECLLDTQRIIKEQDYGQGLKLRGVRRCDFNETIITKSKPIKKRKPGAWLVSRIMDAEWRGSRGRLVMRDQPSRIEDAYSYFK